MLKTLAQDWLLCWVLSPLGRALNPRVLVSSEPSLSLLFPNCTAWKWLSCLWGNMQNNCQTFFLILFLVLFPFAAPLCNYALYFITFVLGRRLWLFNLGVGGLRVANEGNFYMDLFNLSWLGEGGFGSRVIQALSQSKIQMLIILAWCRYQRQFLSCRTLDLCTKYDYPALALV